MLVTNVSKLNFRNKPIQQYNNFLRLRKKATTELEQLISIFKEQMPNFYLIVVYNELSKHLNAKEHSIHETGIHRIFICIFGWFTFVIGSLFIVLYLNISIYYYLLLLFAITLSAWIYFVNLLREEKYEKYKIHIMNRTLKEKIRELEMK